MFMSLLGWQKCHQRIPFKKSSEKAFALKPLPFEKRNPHERILNFFCDCDKKVVDPGHLDDAEPLTSWVEILLGRDCRKTRMGNLDRWSSM
jgi:hypothetical protein